MLFYVFPYAGDRFQITVVFLFICHADCPDFFSSASIEIALMPPAPKPAAEKKDVVTPAPRQKKVKSYSRQILFPAKTLRDDADIDAYVEKIREQLRNLLDGCDEIKLN